MTYKLSILGCGNMCGSILTGTLNEKIFHTNEIVLKNSSFERSKIIADGFGVQATDAQSEIETADFVMLGVKPQMLKDVVLQVPEKTVIISVLAGVTTHTLSEKFSTQNIARVMPNMAAAVNEGLAGVVFTNSMKKEQKEKVLEILNASGKTIVLAEENQMNRFTLLSGSLIGMIGFWEHNFSKSTDIEIQNILTHILYELGAEKFFTESESKKIIDQTFVGYKKMRTETKISAREMQAKVSSKKGVTEAMTDFLSSDEALKIQQEFFNGASNQTEMKNLLRNTFIAGEQRAEALA